MIVADEFVFIEPFKARTTEPLAAVGANVPKDKFLETVNGAADEIQGMAATKIKIPTKRINSLPLPYMFRYMYRMPDWRQHSN